MAARIPEGYKHFWIKTGGDTTPEGRAHLSATDESVTVSISDTPMQGHGGTSSVSRRQLRTRECIVATAGLLLFLLFAIAIGFMAGYMKGESALAFETLLS